MDLSEKPLITFVPRWCPSANSSSQ